MNKNNLRNISLTLLTLVSLVGCLSSESQAENKSSATSDTTTNSAPASTTVTKGAKESKDTTASTSEFVEGKHYVEIFPEMNIDAAAGEVEVVELFWLGCPHCEALEPTIKAFKKSKPDYVKFKQVPATLNPSWAFHAKAFYVGQLLDPSNEKDLIGKLFHAIHKEKKHLNDMGSLKAFFVAQGYTTSQFDNTFNSMALNAAMGHATTISEASQSGSVPTLIINGKYRTSPYMAGGEVKLMQVLDMLIKKEKK